MPGEYLFAFLHDNYVVSAPERTRAMYDLLADKLFQSTGSRLHTGKTRTWNRGREVSQRMVELGLEVWSLAGVKILGTPVGSEQFVERVSRERLAKERELWVSIPKKPDLQCAWQLLLQCARPRCHHFLRTVRPRPVQHFRRTARPGH